MKLTKKFLMTTAIITICMVGTFNSGNMAHAETQPTASSQVTSVAHINQAKISINGGSVVTLPAYLVDNYNYVRVRDLCKALDLYVTALYDDGKEIVHIETSNAYNLGKPDTSDLPPLVDDNVSVTVKPSLIDCNGLTKTINGFNYQNRNYFKLADVAQLTVEGKSYSLTDPSKAKTFAVAYDSTKNVVNVTINGSTVGTTRPTQPTPKPTDSVTDDRYLDAQGYWVKGKPYQSTPLPYWTEPPIVGSHPAHVLIDSSKPFTGFDGTEESSSNLTEPYKNENVQTCTGYAIGRFKEVNGFDSEWISTDLSKPINSKAKVVTDVNDIQPYSILVCSDHQMFIEYVERDESGNPLNIYLTDSGVNGHKEYSADGENGKVWVIKFITLANDNLFIGYIVPTTR